MIIFIKNLHHSDMKLHAHIVALFLPAVLIDLVHDLVTTPPRTIINFSDFTNHNINHLQNSVLNAIAVNPSQTQIQTQFTITDR